MKHFNHSPTRTAPTLTPRTAMANAATNRGARVLQRLRRRQPRARPCGGRALRHCPRPGQRPSSCRTSSATTPRCPKKFMPAPGATHYVAPSKYTQIAYVLGFGGHGEAEADGVAVTRVEELLDSVDMPRSLAEAGIARADFHAALRDLRAHRLSPIPACPARPAHPARLGAARAARGRLRRPVSVRPALPHPSRRRRRRARPRRRLGMARQAAADGIATLCATPHIRHDHASIAGARRPRRPTCSERRAARACRVQVAPGGEVAEPVAPDLDDARAARRRRSAAAGAGSCSSRARAAVGLARGRGRRAGARGACAALVAHPERHLVGGPRRPPRGARAPRRARAGHRRDAPDRRRGRADDARAGRRGLVHVLGSDAHSSRAGRRWHWPAPAPSGRGSPLLRPTVTGSRGGARGDRRAASRSSRRRPAA